MNSASTGFIAVDCKWVVWDETVLRVAAVDRMDMEQMISEVDVERLYTHVLKTEGVRHVLDNPENLEVCADYIRDQFIQMGLKVNEHKFRVEGFDYEFRNIEAWLGNNKGPDLLITSHYDTIATAPGANDNGSAIAVMLETARVLNESNYDGNVRFISFNLEEGNPLILLQYRALETKYGIRNVQGGYSSWNTAKLMKQFLNLYTRYSYSGLARAEVISKATIGLRDLGVHGNELNFFNEMKLLYEGMSLLDVHGMAYCMGSHAWLRDALKDASIISGVLNLETIGYVSDRPNSQNFPTGLDPEMFNIYNTRDDLAVGDFITVVGDRNSGLLAASFRVQCSRADVDLPYACLQQDFSYEQAAHIMPELLRSDHAPFWREDIPALMLTDSANFRYPFYHTQADTIDHLDFDFLAKICKATICTASDLGKVG